MDTTIYASPDLETLLKNFREEHQRVWQFLQQLETALDRMEDERTATHAQALTTLKRLIPQLDEIRHGYNVEDEVTLASLQPLLDTATIHNLRDGREGIEQLIEIFEAELERTHAAPCVGFRRLGRMLWKRLWEHSLYEGKLLQPAEQARSKEKTLVAAH